VFHPTISVDVQIDKTDDEEKQQMEKQVEQKKDETYHVERPTQDVKGLEQKEHQKDEKHRPERPADYVKRREQVEYKKGTATVAKSRMISPKLKPTAKENRIQCCYTAGNLAMEFAHQDWAECGKCGGFEGAPQGYCAGTGVMCKEPYATGKRKKECAKDEYPVDFNDHQCQGLLEATAAKSKRDCEEACCSSPDCVIFQWCEKGGRCTPLETCWLGPAESSQYCKYEPGSGWSSRAKKSEEAHMTHKELASDLDDADAVNSLRLINRPVASAALLLPVIFTMALATAFLIRRATRPLVADMAQPFMNDML